MKGPGVEEKVDALPGGELAPLVLGIYPLGASTFLRLLAQVLELVQLPISMSADDHIERVLLPWNNPQKLANIRPFRKFTDAWKPQKPYPVLSRKETMSIVPNIQPKKPSLIGGRTFEWGSKTFVMGVINVTPDSFSGDGVGSDIETAVRTAKNFAEWGCDIIDVGGESTRPAMTYADAATTSEAEELRRVVPAIEGIVATVDIPVSVDTYKASVARAALEAGATLVNDVWGLTDDPDMAGVVAGAGVPVAYLRRCFAFAVRSPFHSTRQPTPCHSCRTGLHPHMISRCPAIGHLPTARHRQPTRAWGAT